MPRNGYWVECVPANTKHIDIIDKASETGYIASPTSFPDVHETASTPDEAINRIRARLMKVRSTYAQSGKILPEMDNPVRPPNRLRNVQGWISVYIVVSECAASEV
jgi:predicted RNase H-like HicB family nuclease